MLMIIMAASRLPRDMQEVGVPCVHLLLHSNGDLRNSTVVGRLSVFEHVGGFHGRLPQGNRNEIEIKTTRTS
jgi:hypothetical protein